MNIQKIEHIVVLMLENRSFDSILGGLYPDRPDFNGLKGNEFNLYHGKKYEVWNDPVMKTFPTMDPGEAFKDMNQQIFDLDVPSNTVPENTKPSMKGFVKNYAHINPSAHPGEIMHYYTPDQVPVTSFLAKQYAVCDAWHASSPTQTWPNRFFCHTATAGGYPNNLPPHFPYTMKSIFSRLSSAGIDWKVYFKDFPLTSLLSDTWDHLNHFEFLEHFEKDAAEGNLPSYSFIEPSYFASETEYATCQTPTSSGRKFESYEIPAGERFTAKVYNALRQSPCWEKSLLLIIYDENGGIYDHVPPPSAPMPEKPRKDQMFSFNRFGARVPAIAVSPFIKAGTIFRAQENSQPFDHTSVIATLRKRFDLGGPLTNRDKNAPDLSIVLNQENPTNNGPLIPIENELPFDKEVLNTELSDLQKSIHHAVSILPDLSVTSAEDHLKKLFKIKKLDVEVPKIAKHSIKMIKDKLQRVFHHLEF